MTQLRQGEEPIDPNVHYVVVIKVEKVTKRTIAAIRDTPQKTEREVTELSHFAAQKATLKGALNFSRGHIDLLSGHLSDVEGASNGNDGPARPTGV